MSGPWAWARLANTADPPMGQEAYFQYEKGRWILVSQPEITKPTTNVPESALAQLSGAKSS
jgi:hypothetical protein